MRSLILLFASLISACNCSQEYLSQVPFSSGFVSGVEGQRGKQTAVYRDTRGNALGYYEYLPAEFDTAQGKPPLIFYWNGSNAISGNGRDELTNLLTQGLPQYIAQGKHYPAIIISAMLPNWKSNDIHPFVEYILAKYKNHFNSQKIYMTGFSAGGGVTLRYAARHPEKLAAIVPIAAAIRHPDSYSINAQIAKLASWLFHNNGDSKVESWRSIAWHQQLLQMGGEHKITLYESDSHYAWQAAYDNEQLWSWLWSQKSTYVGES